MCKFRVIGGNVKLHVVVFYLCTCTHTWPSSTSDAKRLVKKLLSPHTYPLWITDTNLIKNYGRIKGIGAFLCICMWLLSLYFLLHLASTDVTHRGWINEWWRLGGWFLRDGIVWEPRLARTLLWLRSVSAKKHNEYPGKAEWALSKIHLQFIEATHGESSRGVYHGNCWGLMASRAGWVVGLPNNELFSPINLALTYKKSITSCTPDNSFFLWGGEGTWAQGNF